MKVKIKRIDKSLPLPIYESDGAAGFDFIARETVEITPGQLSLIPSNVVVETPPGYMLQITSRSSVPKKKGLLMPHGVGIIDSDYCGNEDEILIQVYNFTNTSTVVHRGEKIAQGIFVKIDTTQWEEVDSMQSGSRGGFGSTDK